MHLSVINRFLQVQRPQTTRALLGLLDHYGPPTDSSAADIATLVQIAIDCTDGNHAAAKRRALAVIVGIPTIGDRSLWPRLNLTTVSYELVIRILEPRRVRQGGYGLCGPASFAVLLSKSRPEEYAKLAYGLLRYGRYEIDGLQIAPSQTVRFYNPGGNIPSADWLVLASVRNCSDRLDQDLGRYGGTTLSDMFAWLRNAGYGTIVAAQVGEVSALEQVGLQLASLLGYYAEAYHPHKPEFLTHDLEQIGQLGFSTDIKEFTTNLVVASTCAENGWHVFLMITEVLATTIGDTDPIEARVGATTAAYTAMGQQPPAHVIATARAQAITALAGSATNHWVLVKRIDIDPVTQKVRLTRYSYGTKATTAPLDIDVFKMIYGGFIAVTELEPVGAAAAWQ